MEMLGTPSFINAQQIGKHTYCNAQGGEHKMPDYGAMYRHLFNTQTDIIKILQRAHQETEEMYMSAPDPEITLIGPEQPAENQDGKN